MTQLLRLLVLFYFKDLGPQPILRLHKHFNIFMSPSIAHSVLYLCFTSLPRPKTLASCLHKRVTLYCDLITQCHDLIMLMHDLEITHHSSCRLVRHLCLLFLEPDQFLIEVPDGLFVDQDNNPTTGFSSLVAPLAYWKFRCLPSWPGKFL